MITKQLARMLSERLREDEDGLQERLDMIGTLEELPLPRLKEGLSAGLDARKLPSRIENEDYHETTMHLITHEKGSVIAKLFSEADEEEKDIIKDYRYGSISPDRDRLMGLHKAATDEGVLIIIPEDVEVKEPIDVLSEYDTNGFCHLIIIAKRGSKATINRTLRERRKGQAKGMVCEVLELHAKEDAQLTYNEHQDLSEETSWYSQKRGTVHPYATIRWYSHVTGADLSLQETTTTLAGHDSEAVSLCTTRLGGEQQSLSAASTYHAAASTKSGMYAKAVIEGKARTLHKGLVDMGDEAKGAEGYQREDIIITSDQAQADTIPQLEIRNEEVACSHGSTIGNIDEEQLFYLRSRGLGEEEARSLITEGYLASITEHAKDEEWKTQIRRILQEGRS